MGVQVPPPTRTKVLVKEVDASRSGSRPNSLVASWTQIGHKPFEGHAQWTQVDTGGWGGTWPENVGRRGESWFFRVDLPPGPDGKRRQKRVGGFATEREARRALAQSKVDIDTGKLRYGARRTVAELAAEWLEAVRPNRKASTFSNYGWLMRAYVVPRIGPARLDRLTPADVQKLYSDLRSSGGQGGKPLSGTQVHNIHGVLHNALSYAVRMGYISRNPAEAIDKPRQDTEERPVYTPDQVRHFLAVAEGDRLRAMWHLELATGLRRAELAGLRWRDVTLDRDPPVLAVREHADDRRPPSGGVRPQDPVGQEGPSPRQRDPRYPPRASGGHGGGSREAC